MAVSGADAVTPAEVVTEAARELAGLAEVLWAARPPGELVAAMEQLEGVRSLVAGLQARLLTEIDAAGIARQHLSWSGTGAWLTHAAGLRRGAGSRVLATAKALTGPLTATLAALEAGRVSPEQATVIAEAVDRLPGSPVVRAQAEEILLAEAERLDATDLQQAARHLARVVDPDGEDRKAERDLAREERAAHLGRRLSIVDDGAGGVRVSGRGSVEDAALLRAALLPLTTPTPTGPDETGEVVPDPRDHGARLWDALIGLAGHALDCEGLLPTGHGARPRVAVTLDYRWLADAWARSTGGSGAGAPGPGTPGPGAPGPGAPGPCTPGPCTPGPSAPGPGTPGPGAAGPGEGLTGDGLAVSAETIRRWACDADVIPVVLGRAGEVLDVGRRHRLVTAALWQALVVRDGHCAFPSCTLPPVMCHAHHIVPWADGGPTSLSNLVLLCRPHHTHLHQTPWQVSINPTDQKPEFTPPPRHHRHQPEPIRTRPRRE